MRLSGSSARLYRQKGYETFEGYCREEWGWGRSYAYEQIKAAEVVEEMSGIPDAPSPPTNAAQARPLTRIEDPEERAEIWQETVEEAEAEGETVTAARGSLDSPADAARALARSRPNERRSY